MGEQNKASPCRDMPCERGWCNRQVLGDKVDEGKNRIHKQRHLFGTLLGHPVEIFFTDTHEIVVQVIFVFLVRAKERNERMHAACYSV